MAEFSQDILFDELTGILLVNEIEFKGDVIREMEKQGFTKQQVIEECSAFKSYENQRILRRLAIEARRRRVISGFTDWGVKDAVDLARWCKSKEGKDFIDLLTSPSKSKGGKDASDLLITPSKSKEGKDAVGLLTSPSKSKEGKYAIDTLRSPSKSKQGKDSGDLVESSCKKGKRPIAVVTEMEKSTKRVRHTLHSFNPEDYAWVSILDIQLADLSSNVSLYKAEAEKEIAELNNKIEAVKKRIVEYEEETKNSFGAAGLYRPLNLEATRRECWKRYLEEHKQIGILLPNHDKFSVMDAVERHKYSVLEEHKTRFCADNSVRDNLQKYLKDKIRRLEYVNNFGVAKKYKYMLIVSGCEMDEEAPIGDKTDATVASGTHATGVGERGRKGNMMLQARQMQVPKARQIK